MLPRSCRTAASRHPRSLVLLLQQRQRQQQQCWQSSLSTADALPPFSMLGNAGTPPPPPGNNNTTNNGSPPPPPPKVTTRIMSLPTKHSRRRLPAVITDTAELTELTLQLIETEVGHLFTCTEEPTRSSSHSQAALMSSSSAAAWEAADTTVQRFEAAVRGYAHLVPGTMWNRWLPKDKAEKVMDVSATDMLQVQQQLIDRIYQEGYAYMSVRAMRMEEVHGAKDAADDEGDFDARGNRRSDGRPTTSHAFEEDYDEEKEVEHEFTSLLLGGDDDTITRNEHGIISSKQQDADVEPISYLHDFALPGPTVAMYDTVLDTLACSAAACSSSDAQEMLDTANHLHDTVLMRHVTDGGDATNTNPHTRPTAVTFNALLRVAAELPYHYHSSGSSSLNSNNPNALQLRDDAVTTAISTLQAMHECGVVHRNSACYTYALQCVAKYMPPSKIRGNIGSGIFHQARYFGLVNESVVQAYVAANTPSNQEAWDDFIRDKLVASQWPPKWKRESRKRQFHPREHTY